MEIIIALFLVAVAVAWYYNAKRDVPADLVKKDQDSAPYKVESTAKAADEVVIAANPVVPAAIVPAPAKKKVAARTAAPKKTTAKKPAPAAKKTVKKKTA